MSNLIFFEWDNVLFPKNYLTGTSESEEKTKNIKEISRKIILLLRTALSVGKVFLITEDSMVTFRDIIVKYAPDLAPWLQQLTVLSPAENYQKAYLDNVLFYQCVTYKAEVDKIAAEEKKMKILMIGDKFYGDDISTFLMQQFTGIELKAKYIKLKDGYKTISDYHDRLFSLLFHLQPLVNLVDVLA